LPWGHPVPYGLLTASLASTHSVPGFLNTPPSGCDHLKCLQTLSHIFWACRNDKGICCSQSLTFGGEHRVGRKCVYILGEGGGTSAASQPEPSLLGEASCSRGCPARIGPQCARKTSSSGWRTHTEHQSPFPYKILECPSTDHTSEMRWSTPVFSEMQPSLGPRTTNTL
jgi:hypothetical protein